MKVKVLTRLRKLFGELTSWKLFFIITAIIILHNELLSYLSSYSSWPAINKDSGGVTLLLVADAQIVGYEGEGSFVGPITRRDNYHYLWLTYRLARYHVRPDVVVFLGDLIDEGSTTDDRTFGEYVKTFKGIYGDIETTNIYIPGDNDVGGEGDDVRETAKVDRFARYFGSTPSVTTLNNINFVKLSNEQSDAESRVVDALYNRLDRSKITVVLNHDNILPFRKQSYSQMLEKLNASLVVTAHLHKVECGKFRGPQSYVIACRSRRGKNFEFSHFMVESTYKFRISTPQHKNETIHEIIVPTCSYRMGQSRMGFGVLQISENGDVIYSLLWLPRRLDILISYFLIPVAFCGILVYGFCSRYWRRWRDHVSPSGREPKLIGVREHEF